jgi:hypothetical protein
MRLQRTPGPGGSSGVAFSMMKIGDDSFFFTLL